MSSKSLSPYGSDSFITFLNTRIHDAVVECLRDEPRGQLLDAGAGDGTLAARLRDVGYEVRATDLHPEAFRPADIPIEAADLNNGFPFASEQFDVVVATEVIEHLENPWFFLRELYRITRVGGIAIVSTPNLANVYVRAYFLLTGKLFNFLDSAYRSIGHVTPVFLWNLERMAESKFEVESVTVNESPIPKTKIRIPRRTVAFGQCIVVKLRRLPGPPDAEPRVWTSAIVREDSSASAEVSTRHTVQSRKPSPRDASSGELLPSPGPRISSLRITSVNGAHSRLPSVDRSSQQPV